MRGIRQPLVLLLLMAGIAVAGSGCSSSKAAAKSDFDRRVAFAEYETFAVADEAGEFNVIATDGYEVAVMQSSLAPDLRQIAHTTIVERLEKKGLRLADSMSEADLIVTYLVNIGATPEVLAPDYRVNSWSSEAELGQAPVARGTLVLDILDPNLGQAERSYLVWRGWVSNTVDVEGEDVQRGSRLRDALKRIIARYPQ